MGNALGVAQFGGKHPSAKPWKGEGPGVFEMIVEDFLTETPYRAIYDREVLEGFHPMSFTRSRRSRAKGQQDRKGVM